MRSAVLGVLIFWLLAAACSTSEPGGSSYRSVAPGLAKDSSPGGSLRAGTWGGDHLRLTVTGAGASLEFDCASGNVPPPIVVDVDGRVDAPGVYVQEHGGPTREGEVLPTFSVHYRGEATGDTLTLRVDFEDGRSFGPYELRFGDPGHVFKCL